MEAHRDLTTPVPAPTVPRMLTVQESDTSNPSIPPLLQNSESALTVGPSPGGAGSWPGRKMLKRVVTSDSRDPQPQDHSALGSPGREADKTDMSTREVEMMGNLFLVDPCALRENARSWAGREWRPHYLTNDEVMSHPSARYLTEFEAEVFRVFGPPAPTELPAVPPVITLIPEDSDSEPLV